jgi:hypothetical protein
VTPPLTTRRERPSLLPLWLLLVALSAAWIAALALILLELA